MLRLLLMRRGAKAKEAPPLLPPPVERWEPAVGAEAKEAAEAEKGDGSPLGGAIPVAVRTSTGQPVAELLLGPRSTVLSVKRQLAGIEGTPVDNQTLLLNGRALGDDSAKLPELGIHYEAVFTLVVCAPLLSGRLSKGDLESLVSDDAALSRSIDAFSPDPCYDTKEVIEVVTSAAAALLPCEPGLAEEILQALPLDLLATRSPTRRANPSERSQCYSYHLPPDEKPHGRQLTEEEPLSEPLPDELPMGRSASATMHFDMAADLEDTEPLTKAQRRERFTSCIRAALQVLLVAIREHSSSSS